MFLRNNLERLENFTSLEILENLNLDHTLFMLKRWKQLLIGLAVEFSFKKLHFYISRFCSHLKHNLWAKDRLLGNELMLVKEKSIIFSYKISFRSITIPVFLTSLGLIFIPIALLGYDGWILRKLFEKEGEKIF